MSTKNEYIIALRWFKSLAGTIVRHTEKRAWCISCLMFFLSQTLLPHSQNLFNKVEFVYSVLVKSSIGYRLELLDEFYTWLTSTMALVIMNWNKYKLACTYSQHKEWHLYDDPLWNFNFLVPP